MGLAGPAGFPQEGCRNRPARHAEVFVSYPSSKRRVVVTGLGIVSPVGSQVDTAWDNVVNGRSGARGYLYLQSDPDDLTVGWLVRD